MSQAAHRLPPLFAPSPGVPGVQPAAREPAGFDAGGPVAALHDRLAAELLAPAVPAHQPWAFERASRALGPIALLAAYAGTAALLFA